MKDHNIPDNTRVQFVHLHTGNSTRRQRKGSKFMTLCKLWTEENTPELMATGVARCNEHDAASRKVGREVALGRALKALEQGVEQWPINIVSAPKRASIEDMIAEERLRSRIIDLIRKRSALECVTTHRVA